MKRSTRREFLGSAAGGTGVLALSRCSFDSAPATAPRSADRVVVVQTAWPQSLDPSMDINVNAGNLYLHLLEAPARYVYDHHQEKVVLEPLLCERWENLAPDRWRFFIRPGLAFSNGEKITSEVARFSLATIKGNKGTAAPLMAHIREVVPVDDLSFDVVTEGAYAATPASTAFLFFLPPKYYGESGGRAGFGRKPVGSGPYRFVEWQEGVHITLQANASYWGVKPGIQTITFRAQPETATRVALLETEEADLISGVPPELISHVRGFADVKTARALRRVYCFFNCFVPPTDNPLVRKALNYAIDVESLVKYVLEGHAYPAKGINKPGYVGYAPEKLVGYHYDPQRATALLAEAGYRDGIDLDYNHPIGRWLNDKDVATAITGMAAKAGIRLRQKGGEFNTIQSLYTSQKATGMNMWSVGPLWLDPSYEWQVPFWSKGLYRYSYNDRMDALLDRLRREIDPARREAVAQEFEKYVVDEYCPWLFLYDEEHIYGVNRRLDWNPSPFDWMHLQFATLTA
jgi:peptide/nickel transport system substrate-binding protein